MATSIKLKENLHKLIEEIDDKEILKAVYTILEREVSDFELTDSQKKELDRREKRHKSGESNSYNWEETKKIIRKK